MRDDLDRHLEPGPDGPPQRAGGAHAPPRLERLHRVRLRKRFEQAADKLAEWFLDGKIVSDEDISDGIEHAPGAIASVYAGRNSGKKLIYIGQ